MTVRDDVRRALNRIQLEVEEILSLLPEDLTVGDGGVAEAVIDLENDVIKAQGRLEKQAVA